MEPACIVECYTFVLIDIAKLPMPENVRRGEVEVFIDREAETLRYWKEQETELGLFRWAWLRQDLGIAEWNLGEWFDLFRDLRIFFYVHPPEGANGPSIHLLAIQEDGEDFHRHDLGVLLERREAVLSLIEARGGLP